MKPFAHSPYRHSSNNDNNNTLCVCVCVFESCSLSQRLRISSEKLAEAKGAYDMVDKLIMRLDKDMRKIDEEVRVKESDAGYLASAIAAGTASASVKPEKVLTQLNQPQGGGGVGVANILSTLMNSEDASADKDPKNAGVKRKEPESSSKISKGAPSPCLGKPAVQAAPLYAADEDPHEPKYCVCERVSYGEMIACDNPTCLREWFHFDCVGLEAKPKGKWYCEECRTSLKRAKTK